MSNGHSTAVNRAMSYFSQGSWYKELVEGIAFYQFLCDTLKNYEIRKVEVIRRLNSIGQKIFRKAYLLADMTMNQEGLQLCLKPLAAFEAKLYTTPMSETDCSIKQSAYVRNMEKPSLRPAWCSITPAQAALQNQASPTMAA